MAINLLCLPLQATIVRFDTVLGSFSVRMFDTATPLSTQNFLNYVNDGDFVDSFFHRSVPGFIVHPRFISRSALLLWEGPFA